MFFRLALVSFLSYVTERLVCSMEDMEDIVFLTANADSLEVLEVIAKKFGGDLGFVP